MCLQKNGIDIGKTLIMDGQRKMARKKSGNYPYFQERLSFPRALLRPWRRRRLGWTSSFGPWLFSCTPPCCECRFGRLPLGPGPFRWGWPEGLGCPAGSPSRWCRSASPCRRPGCWGKPSRMGRCWGGRSGDRRSTSGRCRDSPPWTSSSGDTVPAPKCYLQSINQSIDLPRRDKPINQSINLTKSQKMPGNFQKSKFHCLTFRTWNDAVPNPHVLCPIGVLRGLGDEPERMIFAPGFSLLRQAIQRETHCRSWMSELTLDKTNLRRSMYSSWKKMDVEGWM